MNKYKFSVVTPTYNREPSLKRLYKSLCNQIYKDFLWIVVDDGSIDNTRDLVNSFIDDGEIRIKYIFKENGGKHTALIESFKYIKDTEYFLVIDSDDELTVDALKEFSDTWATIELLKNRKSIGLIKARTKHPDEDVSSLEVFKNRNFVDMTYQDFTIKLGYTYECITCHRTKEINEYFDLPTEFIYSDKMKFFPEGIMWARAGRKTKTRYIDNVLSIVHSDADGSLCRVKNKKDYNYLYRYIVGIKYYLVENIDYLWKYRKRKVIKDLIYYTAICRLVGITRKELKNNIPIRWLRYMILLLYPVSMIVKFGYLIRDKVR